jgi:hypothetical protein
MATKQVRVCDRCEESGAVTVIVLVDGMPRKEDLCPQCREPIVRLWEQMPRPTPRNTTRRLTKSTMEDVQRAVRARRTPRKPSAPR